MGEARRRSEQGLPPRETKNNNDKLKPILGLLAFNEEQRERFFNITKAGAWIGIILLIIFWITVRFIGPLAGWWTPADSR